MPGKHGKEYQYPCDDAGDKNFVFHGNPSFRFVFAAHSNKSIMLSDIYYSCCIAFPILAWLDEH